MEKNISLNYGSGGALTKKLINEIILKYFKSTELKKLNDSAIIKTKSNLLAFTTDSYVIKPLFFPGGDIGKLAICGTVNDLSVQFAKPLFISVGLIIEEGLSFFDFEKIIKSMAETSKKAGVEIVTGDTKVIEKGKGDGIYINTAGIGEILNEEYINLWQTIKEGDKIIVSGSLGDHSIAVLSKREEFNFKTRIKSDCTNLNKIVEEIIKNKLRVKFIRDITRGGLATILNELAEKIKFNILINEKEIPIKKEVQTICNIIGFNPLYLANEGKLLFVIDKSDEKKLFSILKKYKETKAAKSIGEILTKKEQIVILKNIYGVNKILDILSSEQLPRIC